MTIYGANGGRRPQGLKWADHPEAIEFLRTAWAAGDSCTEIATKLNELFHVRLTRNAVIGKIHRLGLRGDCPPKEPNRNHPGPKRKYRRAPWANGIAVYSGGPRPKNPEANGFATDLEPETSANPVGIFDVKDVHCRWPVNGAGYQVMFCGDPAVRAEGRSYPYCPHHCRMAYRTVSQMRAEAKAHALRNGSMPFVIRSSHIT